ncbi:GNAT family N-acetyltransferase [Amazonocrinis nigriterrae]|uniref:GNAT family N-acetyltransferase n=1 Tax=Amazonocrinis nigriterrae TaxID=2840443 RepID=UPI00298F30D8|nr:GNAT family N-acetyltransferase [Amazonocrinis nigriterrae]
MQGCRGAGVQRSRGAGEDKEDKGGNTTSSPPSPHSPIACLWVGNAIDQVRGDRHAHIFLLYVEPEHRRRGIGTALLRYLENWATQRGDRQIGLQVFQSNQAALNLYSQLGYESQSLWMVKSLNSNKQTGA